MRAGGSDRRRRLVFGAFQKQLCLLRCCDAQPDDLERVDHGAGKIGAVALNNGQLSTSAFYRHFDDVTELIEQLQEEVGGELYALVKEWNASPPEAFAAAAERGLTEIARFFQQHGPLIRAVSDAATR